MEIQRMINRFAAIWYAHVTCLVLGVEDLFACHFGAAGNLSHYSSTQTRDQVICVWFYFISQHFSISRNCGR
jgi:hypothetical protein